MLTVSPTSTWNSREQGKGTLFTASTSKIVNDLKIRVVVVVFHKGKHLLGNVLSLEVSVSKHFTAI